MVSPHPLGSSLETQALLLTLPPFYPLNADHPATLLYLGTASSQALESFLSLKLNKNLPSLISHLHLSQPLPAQAPLAMSPGPFTFNLEGAIWVCSVHLLTQLSLLRVLSAFDTHDTDGQGHYKVPTAPVINSALILHCLGINWDKLIPFLCLLIAKSLLA